MKTRIFLAFTLLLGFAITVSKAQQLKILPTGRTIIGTERTGDDPSGLTTVGLFGKGTFYGGSRLSFGDFGSATGGQNAFIGEYGTWDSDILNPHGRNGIYFTIGAANDYVIAKMENDNGPQLNVFGSIKSYGNLLTSDIRLKKNIKSVPIGLSLTNIRKLNAITYDYKTDQDDALLIELDKRQVVDDKEKKSIEKMKKSLALKKIALSNQFGFSAQDIQKIYPELVSADIDGMLSVNYTGLIPILVEAIKEQQTLIDTQKNTIDTLLKDMSAVKKKLGL